MKQLFCISVLIAMSATAQNRPAERPRQNATTWCCGGVIGQIADGGPWKTTITLINFEPSAVATYTLNFYQNNGQPMFLPTNVGVVSTISGVLPINGSRVIETQGIQPGVQEGWAEVDTLDHIGGMGTFRLQLPGQPAVEVAAPLETDFFEQQFRFPLDHINGATAGVAVLNPSSLSTITIFITLRNEDGSQILLDSLTLTPRQHSTFMLSDRYPASAGKRGIVQMQSSGSFNILGLRATPTTGGNITLTSIPPQSEI